MLLNSLFTKFVKKIICLEKNKKGLPLLKYHIYKCFYFICIQCNIKNVLLLGIKIQKISKISVRCKLFIRELKKVGMTKYWIWMRSFYLHMTCHWTTAPYRYCTLFCISWNYLFIPFADVSVAGLMDNLATLGSWVWTLHRSQPWFLIYSSTGWSMLDNLWELASKSSYSIDNLVKSWVTE